jgi:UDP-N-acetylmuramoyl-tripeptide--D-alanyl-D-alanine ligase
MPKLLLRDIIAAVGGKTHPPDFSPGDRRAHGYCFDTRLLRPGELFFALKGEQRNGHEFVEAALGGGAVGAVVSRPLEGLPDGSVQIVVDSPLAALQALASHVRKGLDIPVVAISGSNGKTTTKEMLAHILSQEMRVYRSPGNFNNQIGVPLSILGPDEDTEVLVLELASNHRGEIRALGEIARPDIGVITNIGRAHIGLFGSLEAIAGEKTDVLRCLRSGGTGVVNADDGVLLAALGGIGATLVGFGVKSEADFRASNVRIRQGTGPAFVVKGHEVSLKARGMHNVYNALAAIAASSLLDVPLSLAVSALETFEPVRVKTLECSGITLLDDSYNANPDSVKAALDLLSGVDATRRILVLGEMLELGDDSEALHREVGSLVASSGVDLFVGVGGAAEHAVAEAMAGGMSPEAAVFFESKTEANQVIGGMVEPGDVVLVKGSRLAAMEEVCDFLRQTVEGRT